MAQAYDLEEDIDTVTFLEGRTPLTDTKGTFARMADYRDGGEERPMDPLMYPASKYLTNASMRDSFYR